MMKTNFTGNSIAATMQHGLKIETEDFATINHAPGILFPAAYFTECGTYGKQG